VGRVPSRAQVTWPRPYPNSERGLNEPGAAYDRAMERESLDGIGAADAHLGRPVPLPAVPIPLARWVEVVTAGPEAIQVEWNLDATRPGCPGRLTLYAGQSPPPDRGLSAPEQLGRYEHRTAALEAAEPELRPVTELAWAQDGLHLRLTGQGPWELVELIALAESISG
jgi:hypothetical protein